MKRFPDGRGYRKADTKGRFLSLCVPEPMSGCWLWLGAMHANGYGNFKLGNKSRLAHRAGYELFHDAIPAGLDLDHTCRNRSCVNPLHLVPKTRRMNLLAPGSLSVVKRCAEQTACQKGHTYTSETLRILRDGVRQCRVCDRERKRREYKMRQETI